MLSRKEDGPRECSWNYSVKYLLCNVGFPGGSVIKIPSAMQELQVQYLGWEDPLEEGMATQSSILAWRIPWTEESDELPSTGSQRVGHD